MTVVHARFHRLLPLLCHFKYSCPKNLFHRFAVAL